MIGQRLGSFLIEEKVGEGAMGEVYRALNEKTGKPAAVKVITSEAISRSNTSERFDREAEILKDFRHPNIVRFLAVGRFRGTNYLAMEYLTGGTLENILDRRIFLPWKEAVAYAISICEALSYAHERHVVHRDLKPSNLLFSDKGIIKLTDFGIAKDLEAEALTATGRTLGTAAYMAPEQIKGTPPVSHKTDLYSLGCLMFQMLTGKTPFKGASAVVLMHLHLTETPPRVSTKNTDVPIELDKLVMQLMQKDPSDRPWDADKVRYDLANLMERAERGDPIAMVFSGEENPVRLGIPLPTRAAYGATEQATLDGDPSKGKAKGKKSLIEEFSSGVVERKQLLETIGLVSILVIGMAILGYMFLWPVSAASLYKNAEALMAQDNPARWAEADREYLTVLDKKYPDLYRQQKQAWRDQIALEKARRRAATLEKPNLGRLSEPKNAIEGDFVSVFNEAAGAIKDGDDVKAQKRWASFAEPLKSDRAEERPWRLLGAERAKELENNIAARHARVVEMLDKATRLETEGHSAEAEELRRDVVNRYSMYKDLQDLVKPISDKMPKPQENPKEADKTSAKPGA